MEFVLHQLFAHHRPLVGHLLLAALLVSSTHAQTPLGPSAAHPTTETERRASWRLHEEMRQSSPFRELPWQAIGPRLQGGRIEAIAVDPTDSATFYVGAGSGNLWKTTNHGTSWIPIFDRESTFSIGDIAVAPPDPNVLWVGTGEVLMARSSYAGDGVFRSDDAGATWRNVGLRDTHHIAKVVVHPENPDIVWIAAIGHLYSFNEQRGVFRTRDGGASWERVLYVDNKTGAIDLAIDPENPDLLYAAMWEHSRRVWGHVPHGQGSGIYKTADGGNSWTRATTGFPQDESVGRIGLAIAPSSPAIVYALLDDRTPPPPDTERRQPSGRVFRSTDRGESWTEVSQERIPAGYDFCLIRVAPNDPDRVYIPGQVFWISEDGGRSFTEQDGAVLHLLSHPSTTLHLDSHEMWIDPLNPKHWLLGNDGGLYVTWDGAQTWLHLNNLPVGEFYAVNLDQDEPFNILGGTQDTAALIGPHTSELGTGTPDPWQFVYLDRWGGGDSYFTPRHPVDTHIVYYEHQFGDARRKDLRDGTTVSIRPVEDNVRWPTAPEAEAADEDAQETSKTKEQHPELRRNWMTPLLISHYDPDTLFYGTQFVLRSRDRGDSWQVLSPDLTSNPGPERQGNVPYGTLTSISESPLLSSVLWTGSDDGKVHVTHDGGHVWLDRTGPFEGLWVSRVLASRHRVERAYVTLTGYREDDFRALVFMTENRGESWRSIAAGLPSESVNVVREDPLHENTLYLGTDLGVYVSLDLGETWHSLVGNLPTTPVHDLRIHARDRKLVAATHGRSLFVLDVAPVQFASQHSGSGAPRLLPMRPAIRRRQSSAPHRPGASSGKAVAVVSLEAPVETLQIVIESTTGEPVWTHQRPGLRGLNVIEWDLYPSDSEPERGSFARRRPMVEAGTYRVLVEVGELELSEVLKVLDP